MNSFFVETEAKIFCLLVLGFFWFFQRKSPQEGWAKLKFVYLFLCTGLAVSIARSATLSFLKTFDLKCIYDCALGLCYAVASYFLCEYAFGRKKYKKAVVCAILSVCAFIVFGIAGYFLSKYNINTVAYILVFAVMACFVVNQYNKIRTDNLTKLYNRYGMEEEIREQLHQYARDKSDSFYIITCDLDNFKHINDTWGHLEGDRALMLISFALSKVSKMFDSEVFRIGGDEFVIITNTSEQGLANSITDAIKTELDNLDFRDDFDIRMSMGTALYDGKTHISDLLNSADKKLYEAKKVNKKV